jgi:hypothetical protein
VFIICSKASIARFRTLSSPVSRCASARVPSCRCTRKLKTVVLDGRRKRFRPVVEGHRDQTHEHRRRPVTLRQTSTKRPRLASTWPAEHQEGRQPRSEALKLRRRIRLAHLSRRDCAATRPTPWHRSIIGPPPPVYPSGVSRSSTLRTTASHSRRMSWFTRNGTEPSRSPSASRRRTPSPS